MTTVIGTTILLVPLIQHPSRGNAADDTDSNISESDGDSKSTDAIDIASETEIESPDGGVVDSEGVAPSAGESAPLSETSEKDRSDGAPDAQGEGVKDDSHDAVESGPTDKSEAGPPASAQTPKAETKTAQTESEPAWRQGMTAQDNDEESQEPRGEEAVDLDTVTVVGTNEAEELKESGYPITIIDPEKFAARAMSVTELLERVPGVRVSRSGGLGSNTRISIRGLEGKRVKIYIDGAPLNAPDGSFAIDDIPLHVIERIEVYKGVVPAKFGGDGLGGAINIVIVELPPKYLDTSYSVASYNQHRAHVLGKTHFEKPGIEWGVFIGGQFASNDYTMTTDEGSYVRDNDQYREAIVATALSFSKLYFDDLELELIYLPNKKDIQGIPGFTGASADVPVRNVQHAHKWAHVWVAATHADKESFLVDKLDLIHGFAFVYMYSGLVDKSDTVYDWDGNSYPSPTGEGEVGMGPNDAKDKRWEIRDRINLNYRLIPQFSLNLNNQIQYTNHTPEDKYADAAAGYPITPQPGNMFFSTTGFSGELSLFDDRWLTVAAFKHYFFSSEGYETSLYPGADLFASPDPVRHSSNNFGGNVATRFRITDWLMLKTSYEHGQRVPTSDEIFGNGFEIKTSPDLMPEVSDNIIGGFYLDSGFGQGRTAVNIKFESDAFLMYLDDMIRLGGLLAKNYENIDEAKIWGVDGEVQLTLTQYFYTYFNWTYQDVRNASEFVPGTTQANHLKGKRMPNTPPYFFNWGAEVTFFDMFGKWGAPTEFAIFYDGTHTADFLYEYEVSENQKRRVPAQTTHDVGFQISFREKRYCLSGSVLNLTGERAYDRYNQPLPGQVFKLALRGTFY